MTTETDQERQPDPKGTVQTGDLPTKSNRQILGSSVAAGREELRRPATGLLVSALAGGLEVGFGVALMAALLTNDPGASASIAGRLLLASAYAFGFVVVVIGRSELFTEHISLLVFPVLNREASLRALLRTWGLVLGANLLGTLLFSWFSVAVLPRVGSASAEAFGHIGSSLMRPSTPVVFASAVLAGWIMGLVAWMVAAARETISQIALVFALTFAIGFLQLHHSIAGSVEVLCAVLVGALPVTEFVRFLLPSVVGNALGGFVMGALVRFGHASRTASAS